MKRYKGYYIDHVNFSSEKEIDEFLKDKAIERFKVLNDIFSRHPSIEASIVCGQQARRLHDDFGFDWEEIERMEVDF